MCFSLQASMITAGALGFVGFLALKDAPLKLRPLAAIPLLFALQQLLEGIVWFTINQNDTTSLLNWVAAYGFLSFASLFWPIYIPTTLYSIEKEGYRRKLLASCRLFGCAVAGMSLLSWFVLGVHAHVVDHHIAYASTSAYNSGILYYIGLCMYLWAIAGALIISSVPYLWLLGILTLITFIIAQTWYATVLGSVWCFFAAIGSGIIYYVVTHADNKTKRT